jgi:hypothetical protein
MYAQGRDQTDAMNAAEEIGDGREPEHDLGLRTGLEDSGLGVPGDVAGHQERAERATTLGVRLALGNAVCSGSSVPLETSGSTSLSRAPPLSSAS